jgi:hypothetical protein
VETLAGLGILVEHLAHAAVMELAAQAAAVTAPAIQTLKYICVRLYEPPDSCKLPDGFFDFKIIIIVMAIPVTSPRLCDLLILAAIQSCGSAFLKSVCVSHDAPVSNCAGSRFIVILIFKIADSPLLSSERTA